MAIYRLQGPDGHVYDLEAPEGTPEDQLISALEEHLDSQPPPPKPTPKKSGIVASAGKGLESLISSARTAFGAATGDANEAARAGLARGEDIASRYEDQTGFDKVRDVYNRDGVLSAAGEVARQVPHVLAEQAPNIASSLAGARLGAMAGSVAGPYGTLLGGGLGAFAPSFVQQFGGNIERQASEQQKTGQPIDVNAGTAAGAAVPQAALDTGAMFFTLGRGLVSKLAGIPEKAFAARSADAAAKLAEERIAATLAKGGARELLSEVPTEVAQQMLERWQAGLPLTTPDAMAEYGETAYQTSLMAPLGVAGRFSEKAGARRQINEQQDAERAQVLQEQEQQRQQALQAQVARRQDPQYAAEVEQRYQQLQTQIAQLTEQAKAGKAAGADLATKQAAGEAWRQLNALKKAPETQALISEFRSVMPVLQRARAQAAQQQDAAAQQKQADIEAQVVDQPAAAAPVFNEAVKQPEVQGDMFGGTRPVTPAPQEDPQRERRDLAARLQSLAQSMEQHQQAESDAAGAGDFARLTALRQRGQQLRTEYEGVAKLLEAKGGAPVDEAGVRAQIEKLKQQVVASSGPGYDPAKVDKLLAKIEELTRTLGDAASQQDLKLKPQRRTSSESTDAFNARTFEPGGYTQPPQEQRGSIFDRVLEQQDELDAQRREGQTAKEISDVEKAARMPTAVQEQGTLFEEPRSEVVSGNGGVNTKSRAQLLADLQIARTAGNREAASQAVEALRDLAAREQARQQEGEQRAGPATPLDHPTAQAMGSSIPAKERELSVLRDQRATAFARLVTLVDRFNKGQAQRSERDAAVDDVTNALMREAEVARGRELDAGERGEVRREAGALLRDLINRWGDTRGFTNLGTREEPQFEPQQYRTGAWNRYGQRGEGPAGMGFTNEEEAVPGRQTFGNRVAAAQTIEEGLNALRNKLVKAGGAPSVERRLTPAKVSPQMLAQQIERDRRKYAPPVAALAQQAQDNAAALANRPDLLEDISEQLHRAAIGNALYPGELSRLQTELGELEKGKRAEAPDAFGIARGMQFELFPQDNVFETGGEFEDFLASDGLHLTRLAKGLLFPTAQRLEQKLRPVREKIDTLTQKLTQAHERFEALEKQRADARGMLDAEQRAQAQAHDAQVRAAKDLVVEAANQLDGQTFAALTKFRDAYLRHAFTKRVVEQLKAQIERVKETFERPIKGLEQRYAKELSDIDGWIKEAERGTDRKDFFRLLKATIKEARDARFTHKQLLDAVNELKPPAADRAKLQKLLALKKQVEVARDKRLGAWTDDARVKPMLTELSALEDQLRAERPLLASHASALKRADAALEKARAEAPAAKELAAAREMLGQVQQELAGKSENVQVAQKLLAQASEQAGPAIKEMQALSEDMRPLVDLVRSIESKMERRAAQRTKPVDRTGEKQAARDAQLTAGQAALERRADEPRTTVSFEPARKLQERRTRDTARQQELEVEAATAMRPEDRAAAQAELDTRRAKVEAITANADRRLAGAMKREAALAAKVRSEQDPGRRAALQTQLDTLREKLSAMRGVERTPVPTREDKAAQAKQAYDRQVAEQLAKLGKGETSERLPARRLGPVAKKAQQAGNIRTGDTNTSEERAVGMRNPLSQEGRARPVTSRQAVAAANKDTERQALVKEQVRLETLQGRVENAVEDAREAVANATTAAEKKAAKELLAKREDQLARVERAVASIERKVEAAAPMAVKTRTERLDEITREAADDMLLQAAATGKQGPRMQLEWDENMASVMHKLAQQTRNPVTRALAERLKMLLGNSRIELVDDLRDDNGTPAYGMASVDGTKILLDSRTGANEQTVLHEATHAAVERALRTPDEQLTAEQQRAKRELQALYDEFLKDDRAPNVNARQSLSEFVAEAMSDVQLQEYLRAKPWTLKHMWESFKSAVLKMLGVEVPRTQLDAALAAVDSLMQRVARPDAAQIHTAPEYLLRPKVANEWRGVMGTAERVIAREKPLTERVRNNGAGLWIETQYVDRFAALDKMSKLMEPLKGTQMMFWARMYDQRFHHVAQAVGTGVPQRVEFTRPDGEREFVLEAKQGGSSLRSVVQALRPAAEVIGSGDAVNRAFTMYLSAIRAKSKGIAALNFSALKQADLDEVTALVNATPKVKEAFEAARREYNQYNRDLLALLADSGAISRDVAAKLLKEDDYIPWYRAVNGNAVMQIGTEAPITVGNLKHQPHLQELVGGDMPIMDFMVSSVQNTNMIVDMALRNLATKDAVHRLQEIGAATILRGEQSGPDIVQFKEHGLDKYARVETDAKGVPAQLLVEGMAGVPTQPTGVLKVLGLPAKLLRKSVTLSPLYAARQLFRDSVAAPLLSGADMTPVLSALAQINGPAKGKLERRGVVGGQIFTGSKEDLTGILRRISDGKNGWQEALTKLESITMEADALTRRAQFESYRKQGLSEMEATLLALESMNFSKRGASPSVWMINTIIPFFNAQIQGLNVLYKSLSGKMPFNEKLRIREKLVGRGMMLMGLSLAYAAAMQDDEAYKNATPDQKYQNWFIRVPGLDEPVKLPVPFEIGYIFKALPEALYNAATTAHGGEEALKAFSTILTQVIPGGTSYGLPQAVKPGVEYVLGKSFYTGRDTLTRKEQTMLPEAQYRADTSELAKAVGKQFGISPVKFEQLISGYFSSLGIAALHAGDPMFAGGEESPEQATRRLSQLPMVGGAFQANDAGGIINPLYDQMLEYKKTKASVDDLLRRGEKAEAMALLHSKSQEYARAQMADGFTKTMTQLSQMEMAVRASAMSPEEKRAALDRVRQAKIRFAASVRGSLDQTTRPALLP